jgi:hypothetical protein
MSASKGTITLLSNGSATSSEKIWPGGVGVFMAHATFGGGSVKLQYKLPDGSTWTDAGADTSLTADGGGVFELPPCNIRAAVATATGVYAAVTHRGD